jgi:hypothetical protein
MNHLPKLKKITDVNDVLFSKFDLIFKYIKISDFIYA